MRSYLDAISPDQKTTVFLPEAQIIDRARFGLHLQLGEIAQDYLSILSQNSAKLTAMTVQRYLLVAGVEYDPKRITGKMLLDAFITLRELNTFQIDLAFMKPGGNEETNEEKLQFEYSGRMWALWIHKLASRYGWSRDHIFSLWPEEAACYLQEILLSEYEELELKRLLSELSWKYDKQSKKSKFVPTPKPGWMIPEYEKEKTIHRVPRVAIPAGVVRSISGMGGDLIN